MTVLGWIVALALAVVALRQRSRLEIAADAAHELRGSAHALGLAAASLMREPGGRRRAQLFESELLRMRAGLEDLDAARAGHRAPRRPSAVPVEGLLRTTAAGWRPALQLAGRSLRVRWEGSPAVVRADRAQLARALGNLMANAVEHGSGRVELRGRRARGGVVLEVADAGPGSGVGRASRAESGRGLSIAGAAVEEAGGRLELERGAEGTTAAVELPLA